MNKLCEAYDEIMALHWGAKAKPAKSVELNNAQAANAPSQTGSYFQRAHCKMARLLSTEERVDALLLTIGDLDIVDQARQQLNGLLSSLDFGAEISFAP